MTQALDSGFSSVQACQTGLLRLIQTGCFNEIALLGDVVWKKILRFQIAPLSKLAEIENFLIFEITQPSCFKTKLSTYPGFETTLLSWVVSVETACANEPLNNFLPYSFIPDVQACDRQRRALEGQGQQADRVSDRLEAGFSRLCQIETNAGN